MAEYLTNQCGPADQAPEVSNYYARCSVCGVQWQVRGRGTDTAGCEFCGAPARCVKLRYEGPRKQGASGGSYASWRR
jgi:hypothetical protein